MNEVDTSFDIITFLEALRNGEVDKVKESLKESPDLVNRKDARGFPLLILAAYNEQSEIVDILLKHGAYPDAKDNSGNTALMGACFKGYSDIAEKLIRSGADVNARNLNDATALIYACTFNQKEIAKKLIQSGADITLKDANGKSALDHARMQGLKWVEELFN